MHTCASLTLSPANNKQTNKQTITTVPAEGGRGNEPPGHDGGFVPRVGCLGAASSEGVEGSCDLLPLSCQGCLRQFAECS